MKTHPLWERGRRVRVHAASPVLTLRGSTGRILGPDPKWDGYYIVHLDCPARYDNGVQPPSDLEDIRVAGDNVEAVEALA